jgi:hypothetical protein
MMLALFLAPSLFGHAMGASKRGNFNRAELHHLRSLTSKHGRDKVTVGIQRRMSDNEEDEQNDKKNSEDEADQLSLGRVGWQPTEVTTDGEVPYDVSTYTSVASISTQLVFELMVPGSMSFQYAGADPCLAIMPSEEDLLVQYTETFYSDHVRKSSTPPPPEQVYVDTSLSLLSYASARNLRARRKKNIDPNTGQRELCLAKLEGYMIFENVPEYTLKEGFVEDASNKNQTLQSIPFSWTPPNTEVIQNLLETSLDVQKEITSYIQGLYILDTLVETQSGLAPNGVLSYTTSVNIQSPPRPLVAATDNEESSNSSNFFMEIWTDSSSMSGFFIGVSSIIILVATGCAVRWLWQFCATGRDGVDKRWLGDARSNHHGDGISKLGYDDFESRPSARSPSPNRSMRHPGQDAGLEWETNLHNEKLAMSKSHHNIGTNKILWEFDPHNPIPLYGAGRRNDPHKSQNILIPRTLPLAATASSELDSSVDDDSQNDNITYRDVDDTLSLGTDGTATIISYRRSGSVNGDSTIAPPSDMGGYTDDEMSYQRGAFDGHHSLQRQKPNVDFLPHQHTNEDMDLMVTPRHNVEEKFEAMWGDGSRGGVHHGNTSGEVEVASDGGSDQNKNNVSSDLSEEADLFADLPSTSPAKSTNGYVSHSSPLSRSLSGNHIDKNVSPTKLSPVSEGNGSLLSNNTSYISAGPVFPGGEEAYPHPPSPKGGTSLYVEVRSEHEDGASPDARMPCIEDTREASIEQDLESVSSLSGDTWLCPGARQQPLTATAQPVEMSESVHASSDANEEDAQSESDISRDSWLYPGGHAPQQEGQPALSCESLIVGKNMTAASPAGSNSSAQSIVSQSSAIARLNTTDSFELMDTPDRRVS